ncbi:CaiB/BaiF CoA transferase family protein [Nocardia niigatensis]
MRMGPLTGLKVLELGGLGPSPHAAMVLGDLGAEVVRVRRPGALALPAEEDDLVLRGRTVIDLDIKNDPESLRRLIGAADVLIEGYRPGVCEKLGIGPEVCLASNPGLIYARVTGWGQDGPRAQQAGHDINFLAATGLLHAIGAPDRPPLPPLNLLADYAGGSLYAVIGILAALFERARSGMGQVVDAAVVDGLTSLSQYAWSLRNAGMLGDRRGSNLLDGAAPFYRSYRTADGQYMAVGALEPHFFALLLDRLGLADADLPPQLDAARWPVLHEALERAFAGKTRAEWVEVFDGLDACVSPVLTWTEALEDEHLAKRASFVSIDGVPQAAVAPRFSRTSTGTPTPPRRQPTPVSELSW